MVLTTCLRVFPTRRPDTADVSATSCDVGFFFSVSYVVSLPNCRHVVVVTTHYVPYTPCVSDLDQETGTNLHTQERNKRFSTLQLLNAAVLSSSFCHVLLGAICHVLLFVSFSLAPYLSLPKLVLMRMYTFFGALTLCGHRLFVRLFVVCRTTSSSHIHIVHNHNELLHL